MHIQILFVERDKQKPSYDKFVSNARDAREDREGFSARGFRAQETLFWVFGFFGLGSMNKIRLGRLLRILGMR